MNPTTLPSLLLGTLCLAAAAQDGAKKITISPKPGATAHYRVTLVQKRAIAAMGHEGTNEIVTDLRMRVDQVAADGTVKATATWLRIRGKLDSMAGGLEFDTDKPDTGAENPALEGVAEACVSMIGPSIALTFGPDGKLKDKKPLADLAAKTAEKMSGHARMMLQGIVGAHVLENQVAVFGEFPAAAVAVGGTWTEKKPFGDARGGLSLQTEVTNKLTASSDEAYVIAATGIVTAVPPKEGDKKDDDDDDEQVAMMKAMMRDATVKDGKLESEVKIARTDGMLATTQSKSTMEIHMVSPMGGDEPFVVAVTQTTKVERFSPAAAK